jgi:hypothetical protein
MVLRWRGNSETNRNGKENPKSTYFDESRIKGKQRAGKLLSCPRLRLSPWDHPCHLQERKPPQFATGDQGFASHSNCINGKDYGVFCVAAFVTNLVSSTSADWFPGMTVTQPFARRLRPKFELDANGMLWVGLDLLCKGCQFVGAGSWGRRVWDPLISVFSPTAGP